jgi:hypothetical protein
MVGGRNITAILTVGIVKGFGQTIVMSGVYGGWQKYYSYIDRENGGRVPGQVLSGGGILLPPSWEA